MVFNISHGEETELQTRNRIVNNAFKFRENCIVLRLDTHINGDKGVNPFGFHFYFDKDKYEENKERKKRESVTKWLALAALIHHKFGFRHILLIVMMALYSILGGVMFDALESENERELLDLTISDLNDVMLTFANDVLNITETETDDETKIYKILQESRNYYKTMLQTEDRYLGSAWHKAEDLDLNLTWNIWSAFFYAFTLFSTIGYGSMYCHTWTGRWVSVIYASIGIPLMLLTIGDLGEVMQRMMCIALQWIVNKIRPKSKNEEEDIEKVVEEEEDDEEEEEEKDLVLPVWIACSILFIYIVIISLCIHWFDEMENPGEGMEIRDSFYFVFISITTIGLGDDMPSSIHYNPVCSLAFLFGLTLISIINSSVYSQLYDSFYSGIMAAEGALDSIHADAYVRDGHRLFKMFSPAFTTLAMSFPSFTPRPSIPHILLTQATIRRNTDSSISSHSTISTLSAIDLDINTRSHSIDVPNHEPEVLGGKRIVRVHSEVTRPRTPSILPLPSINKYKYKTKKHDPTLGPLGGVSIAVERRREGIARAAAKYRNISPIRKNNEDL